MSAWFGGWGMKQVPNVRFGVNIVDKERRRHLIEVGTITCERCLGGQASSVECCTEPRIMIRLSHRNVHLSEARTTMTCASESDDRTPCGIVGRAQLLRVVIVATQGMRRLSNPPTLQRCALCTRSRSCCSWPVCSREEQYKCTPSSL